LSKTTVIVKFSALIRIKINFNMEILDFGALKLDEFR